MGCILWVHHLVDILPQFLQLFMQYLTILDRGIMALNCIFKSPRNNFILSSFNTLRTSNTYMLVNWVNIGSGNDFLDIWHQVTTLTIANFLPFEP